MTPNALLFAALQLAAIAEPEGPPAEMERPRVARDERARTSRLLTGRLELLIDTADGLSAKALRDRKTGSVLADADYVWPGNQLPRLLGDPTLTSGPDGSVSLTFRGQVGAITVRQTFVAPGARPGRIVEKIAISNPTQAPLETGQGSGR